MNHLTEEDLVLHYYGEAESLGVHLANCPECLTRFRELQQTLNSIGEVPVPERGENYGSEVWRRIEGRLPRRGGFRWQTWGAIAAMLALGVTAFWAGRQTSSKASATAAQIPRGAQQRVLVVALTDHFTRSQMVLAEFENAPDPKSAKLDVSYERNQAEDLLDSNRLYRQTALATGDLAAAALLEDLEKTLVEIAHSPEQLGTAEVEHLRHAIEDRGVLFKMQVYSKGLSPKGEL